MLDKILDKGILNKLLNTGFIKNLDPLAVPPLQKPAAKARCSWLAVTFIARTVDRSVFFFSQLCVSFPSTSSLSPPFQVDVFVGEVLLASNKCCCELKACTPLSLSPVLLSSY